MRFPADGTRVMDGKSSLLLVSLDIRGFNPRAASGEGSGLRVRCYSNFLLQLMLFILCGESIVHMESFSPEVIKNLKTYVYLLIDPRKGETLYVGKGKDNRVSADICAVIPCQKVT